MAGFGNLSEVQATTPGLKAALVNTDRLVEPELQVQARRAKRIINKRTGAEFLRKLDENSKWDVLFKYALKAPWEFEIEYDADDAVINEEGPLTDRDGVVVYTEAELMERNIQQLREIGKAYDISGRSKSQLIVDIMKAQRKR